MFWLCLPFVFLLSLRDYLPFVGATPCGSSIVNDSDRRNINQAALISGIDEEINLLRAKLKSVVQHDPENIKLISLAAVSLARLIRTRYYLGKDRKDRENSMKQAIENVFNDIAIPLGLDVAKIIKNKREKQNARNLKK